jgi:hypothetical protein
MASITLSEMAGCDYFSVMDRKNKRMHFKTKQQN